MTTRHRWAATLVAATLLTGLTACADRGIAVQSPPTSEPSREASVAPSLTATVEIAGGLSELADSAEPAFVLNVPDQGYLPVQFAPGVEPDVRSSGAVIAVHEDFDTDLEGAALFTALEQLSMSLGEALTVVELRSALQR